LSLALLGLPHLHAATGSDNAGNYSLGWSNGDNQGSGFGPWEFENNNNNTDRFAGAYLATSNNPSGRNVGIFLPDPSGKAFILYAHPAGAFMNAKRNFGGSNAVPLAVGESFNFQWVQFWGNGDKGVNLYRSGWDDGNDRTISLRQNGDNFIAQPRGFTNSPVAINYAFNKVTTVKLRRAAPDTLVLTVRTDEAADGSYTNTFRSPAPDRVKFYYAHGPAGADENNPRPLFNNLSITADSVPVASRQVKFSVNMGVLEGQTPKKFDPASGDKVFVRGYPSGGWGGTEKVELLKESGSVYSATIQVAGDTGLKSGGFKFFIELGTGGGTPIENGGYETIADREFDLTASDTNLPVVYFNNILPTRNVTFTVDMRIQQLKNLFAPGEKVVVSGAFNGWGTNNELTLDTVSGLYKATISVEGLEGATNNYKFRILGPNRTNDGLQYETTSNRPLVLGVGGANTNLPTAYLNNDDGVGPVITLKGADPLNLTNGAVFTDPGATAADAAEGTSVDITGSGTVNTSVAESYTVTYSASDAAGNAATPVTRTVIVAAAADTTAPVITLTGSATVTVAWGGSYSDEGATGTDNVDTSVTVNSSGSVNTAVPGVYTITYTASDVAGNAATPVTRTVTVSAPSNTSGADGLSGLLRYAFGANGPGDSVAKPTATFGGGNLVLTAIVRTNDAKLAVVGEAGGSLTNWSTNGVSVTGSTNTNGVPDGCQRQLFSVDRTNNPTKQFLRLKATLAP
jgi:hypothetical protein